MTDTIPDSLNLSVGTIPLITTFLELVIIMFFVRILMAATASSSFGQALAFLFG